MAKKMKIRWNYVEDVTLRDPETGEESTVKLYVAKGHFHDVLQAFVGHEPVMKDDEPKMTWHISISCTKRDPLWDEIVSARYALLPHIKYMAQILPPAEEYVDLHHHCYHLWEIDN